MAAPTKITPDMIEQCGLQITQNEGIRAVNARRIATELHCSIQPVYYYFNTMDKLRNKIIELANDKYNQYVEESKKNTEYNHFKSVGMAYIKFAKNEKELFKLLFMTDRHLKTVEKVDDNFDYIIQEVSKMSGLNEEFSKKIFFEIWIVTHGIASMIVTNFREFSDEEVSNILNNCYIGLLRVYKEK